MTLQVENKNLNQNNRHLTQEEFNYKYFYIERKLATNNLKEMPDALNQLESFLQLLLQPTYLQRQEGQFTQNKVTMKYNSHRLELLNSIAIRLLDLLLNLKIFHLKNKIKKLLIIHCKEISLIHNKQQICQVLYKCLRGVDEFSRVISAEIIPFYWVLFQKDLFTYHHLLEQLMANRIKIFSKNEKRAIFICLKSLLSSSKYLSKLFFNDIQKLVLNIAIGKKDPQQDLKFSNIQIGQNNFSKQKSQIQTIYIKNYGIKPHILFLLCSNANFEQQEIHIKIQYLMKILNTYKEFYNYLNVSQQKKMIKICEICLKNIFLKNLSKNFKLVQLFFECNLSKQLKIENQCIRLSIEENYFKIKEFIIQNLSIQKQRQFKQILNQQIFEENLSKKSSKKQLQNLLDYFFQIKKQNMQIYLNESNSQHFKLSKKKMDLILTNYFETKINKEFYFQQFLNTILLTYYSQNNYDNSIYNFIKRTQTMQQHLSSQKNQSKLLKILLTTGNFLSARIFIKYLEQNSLGNQSKNLIFWKLYCDCFIFQSQQKITNQQTKYLKKLIYKLKKLILLKSLAKQMNLNISILLETWIVIYKSFVIFTEKNKNKKQKIEFIEKIRILVGSLEHSCKKQEQGLKDYLSQQIFTIKQMYIQLKNNLSYEKLIQHLHKRKKIPFKLKNDLMSCMYFSKSTILSIYRKLK